MAQPAYSFEITKNKKGEFTLALKSKNSELIFKTEGYVNKSHCKKMAEKITSLSAETPVNDLTIVEKTTVKNSIPIKKPVAKTTATKKVTTSSVKTN